MGALRESRLGKQYGLKLGRRCEGIHRSLELAVEVYVCYSRPLIPVTDPAYRGAGEAEGRAGTGIHG